jgi:hypothetical protein
MTSRLAIGGLAPAAAWTCLLACALACADGNRGGPDLGFPAQAGTQGAGNAGASAGAGAGGARAGAGGSANAGGGAAGNSGTGGAGEGAAGSAGDDGASGDGPDEDDGGRECVYNGPPVIDPADLASCESATCQGAHCLPRDFVNPEQSAELADCNADEECVPDLLIRTVGQFLLASCRSLGGAEGRCLSTCIPRVAEQLDVLPVDVCAEGERCAPCFDPITGEETGSCSQSCDTGPSEDPVVFPDCCGELGVCVPDSLVPDDQLGLLGSDSCTEQGALCAPRAMASDRSFVPATCSSLLDAEGRCLPGCLPDVAAQAQLLPMGGCAAGELCAPCYDPLTGDATSACSIADDEPVEDPVLFADCCGGLSACVPQALVPEDQRAMLDAAGCMAGELCAPKDIASGSYEPQTCTSWGGSEGRCLLACLPDVAAQAARLERGACDMGELCVPCYDPLGGESTGACEIEGDEPAQDPPYVFPTCCDDGMGNDLGTCVPSALVPSAEQALLGADSCSDMGFLCAPTPLANGAYQPESCDSWLGAEGRCLPACLPDVAAQADRLKRATCGQGELCVPCFEPLEGAETGACEIDGDAPVDPAVRFPTCCPTAGTPRGTCVPRQAAGAQADSLPVLNCETQTGDADSYVCAPDERIADPDFEFPSCTTTCGADPGTCFLAVLGGVTGQPGACVPSCILSERTTTLGSAATLYGQSTCATGEDCAPCEDPQTGVATGLCP